MPQFACESRDSSGQVVRSQLVADSESSAQRLLEEEGLFPVKVESLHGRKHAALPGPKQRFGRVGQSSKKVRLKDLLNFSRQLSSTLRAGVPIMLALRSIQEQSPSKALTEVTDQLCRDIEEGQPLSAAMAKHPRAFSKVYTQTVHAGEHSGSLDEMLDDLANYLEGEIEVQSSVRSALLYPTIVVSILCLAVTILVVFVVPRFASVYAGLSTELPWITRALIGFSTWVSDYALLAIAGFLAALYGMRRVLQTTKGKELRDRLLLRVPVVGRVVEISSTLRVAQMLGLFVQAGVPILQGLETIASATPNSQIRRELNVAAESIAAGESLSASLQEAGCFQPSARQMLVAGELTGSLEDSCFAVAKAQRKDLAYLTKNMATLIEPLMTLVLAGLVLFVALAVFLPMWNLASAARR